MKSKERGGELVARSSALSMAPRRLAAALVEEHSRDPAWLDTFSAELDRMRQGRTLARILAVWGLSQSEAGRRFGVSRQAVAKWLSDGIPSDRLEQVATLAAATDLLAHYLKGDRIPAVVRRPIPAMDGQSLLDMLAAGDFDGMLSTCRRMFDFAAVNQ